MSHERAPRWRRRPLLAFCARSAAFLIPLVVSGVAALLVLDAFTGWPAAWRVVWWTSVIVSGTVAALVFVPVAHRLSALGVLLGLEVEFPTPPPSRLRLAVGTSTIVSAQLELARTARADSSDEMLTARLATASMLGVLRKMEVRSEDRARVFSTIGIALCVAVTALLVVPDRAQSPRSPIASEQQAASNIGNDATATEPTAPDSATDHGNADRSMTGTLPSVSETGSASADESLPAAPEPASNAPEETTVTVGAPSAAGLALPAESVRSAGVVPTDVLPSDVLPTDVVPTDVVQTDVVPTLVVPTPTVPAPVAPAPVVPALVVPSVSSPDPGVQVTAVPAPAVVTPAARGPAPDVPTRTEPPESDDPGGPSLHGPHPDVEPPPSPSRDGDLATAAPQPDDEHGGGARHAPE